MALEPLETPSLAGTRIATSAGSGLANSSTVSLLSRSTPAAVSQMRILVLVRQAGELVSVFRQLDSPRGDVLDLDPLADDEAYGGINELGTCYLRERTRRRTWRSGDFQMPKLRTFES